MASTIGRCEDVQRWTDLFNTIKTKFIQSYVSGDGRVAGDSGTSTGRRAEQKSRQAVTCRRTGCKRVGALGKATPEGEAAGGVAGPRDAERVRLHEGVPDVQDVRGE